MDAAVWSSRAGPSFAFPGKSPGRRPSWLVRKRLPFFQKINSTVSRRHLPARTRAFDIDGPETKFDTVSFSFPRGSLRDGPVGPETMYDSVSLGLVQAGFTARRVVLGRPQRWRGRERRDGWRVDGNGRIRPLFSRSSVTPVTTMTATTSTRLRVPVPSATKALHPPLGPRTARKNSTFGYRCTPLAESPMWKRPSPFNWSRNSTRFVANESPIRRHRPVLIHPGIVVRYCKCLRRARRSLPAALPLPAGVM